MSDGLDPSGPSQPTNQQGYETSGNPVSKEPAEQQSSYQNAASNANSEAVDERIPQKQSSSIEDATPSSMGRGIRGAGSGEEAQGYSQEDVGRHNELDGQQMAAPGEGDVADAVSGRTRQGASGEQEDLASDLDRKKAEQASSREDIQQQREQNVDVGGVLGQRGGPANPVDKNNYPNSGD